MHIRKVLQVLPILLTISLLMLPAMVHAAPPTPKWVQPITCEVSGQVLLTRGKGVRAIVHSNGACTRENLLEWTVDSRQKSCFGSMNLSPNSSWTIINEVWHWLEEGDQVALNMELDGVVQPVVSAEWHDVWPVWAWWEPMPDDQGRACAYRWNGETDPYLVGTDGVSEWEEYHSENPWQTNVYLFPNEEWVTFELHAYRDAGHMDLRGYFVHGPVFNPCYVPPATCESVNLSVPAGSEIPDTGKRVDVEIIGDNGDQYGLILGP